MGSSLRWRIWVPAGHLSRLARDGGFLQDDYVVSQVEAGPFRVSVGYAAAQDVCSVTLVQVPILFKVQWPRVLGVEFEPG